jgi:predicted nucleic acid-binding protein
MQSVYVETTVVGHLAGRLRSAVAVRARQLATREWWRSASSRYHLFVSDLVLSECNEGDKDAAKERLGMLEGIDVLLTKNSANALAKDLIAARAVPATEPRDALHIALAALNGIDYLVTWNFKHIMNPAMQPIMDSVCRAAGLVPAVICTPEQLLVIHGNS